MLRAAIAAAVDAGELPRADPARDAATLYDLAMGWLQRRLAQPAAAQRDDARHLIGFALAGLRPEDGREDG